MKQLKLLTLALNHFKGVKSFKFDTHGGNVQVFGDNATGKTTLFDAFVWLLFDKDSQNKKDFTIKTLNQDNEVLHGLDHSVEASFSLDGKPLTLKKVYAEKWTKKRGSATQEFTGHTTDFFIDGVPAKKKEYTEMASSIVDEDVFKLLTSPSYFNEQLHWQDRRKTLLEICGEITDVEVIASNKDLAKLQDILSGRKIEDHKKVIAAKRTEINKELDRIPVRIDEVSRSMPDLSGLDKKTITDEINGLSIRIESKENELSRIRNGAEVIEKEKQLREIESQLLDIKNNLNASVHEKINSKRQSLYDIKRTADDLRYHITGAERLIKLHETTISSCEEIAQKLRQEWADVNQESFSFEDHQTNCPACGQDLPAEQLEETRAKAEAHFNQNKSSKLEQIQSQGKKEMTTANELKVEIQTHQNRLNDLTEKLQKSEQEINAAQKEIEDLQSSVQSVEADPTYQNKQQEADAIRLEIRNIRESVQEAESNVRHAIAEMKSIKAEREAGLSKFVQAANAKDRIQSLEGQERKLAAEFEQLENELFLTEEFIRTKVNLLEDKINSKFKHARFKLFDTQINEGLKETCETLYKGVPYSGGLNNAARINVGLDIINTLSEHYGFSAPIFVDNSEAVTQLMDVNAQMISLIVSEADKQLRVETSTFPEAI